MNGGEHYSLLHMLAMKFLVQCATNSSFERNWSVYKYVHSTIHNKLLADRAEKLVYMYWNEKILSHIEDGGYEESMAAWTCDCCSHDEVNFNVGRRQCTNVEIEQNLALQIEDWDEQIDKQWKDVEAHMGNHENATQD